MKYLKYLFLLLFTACSLIEEPTDPFDFFWDEMDRKYVYFDEKGVDWNAVYATYKPQIKTGSDEEYIQVFGEIVDLLKDGHVWVQAPTTYISYNVCRARGEGEIDMYTYTGYNPSRLEYLHNDIGYIVQLDNSVTYIAHHTFFPTFNYRKFQEQLSSFSYSNGIIVDMRFNSGGSASHLYELAACFFSGERTLLYERYKVGSGHNDFSNFLPINVVGRNIVSEEIPIVILTGCGTYSAANFFAACVKYLPNVRLMGTQTGGGGSGRPIIILPNGWRFAYAYSPTYDIYYNSIEPGVEPHYLIPTTSREEYEETGIHKLMEFAYNYLLNQ